MRLGILAQEKVQLLESSGLDANSKEFQDAYEGRCEGWNSYFEELELPKESKLAKFAKFFKSKTPKFDDPYFNTPLRW